MGETRASAGGGPVARASAGGGPVAKVGHVDMRRRVATLATAAERLAMIRDVAVFFVAYHNMKRGFELLVAVAAQVLQMPGGGVFDFLFGNTPRKSSQAVGARRNMDCPRSMRCGRYDRVPTGHSVHEMGSRGGLWFSVSERPRKRR